MNVLKTLAAVAVIGAGLYLWDTRKPEGGVQAVAGAVAAGVDRRGGGGGFVDIPMPDGLSSRGIVVFAPEHCPRDAGQRAEAMASYLAAQRVPYTRTSSANYNDLASAEEASRVTAVMNGPVPVVYVNGRAKANPTPQEVVAEYRRGKAG